MARTATLESRRNRTQPRVEVTKITPKLAEDWLGRNSHNRPLRNARVEEYAGMIRRGEWLLNGESIKWDWNGVLLDGQHRLWAVVEAGTPIMAIVVWDLPPETQDTMDRGLRRNLGDVLRLRGETSTLNLAAAICLKWREDEGLVRAVSRQPSVQQALAILERHPGLREGIKTSSKVRQRFRISSAVVAVCWYDFNDIDPDACDVFFDKLVTGVNLAKNSPILALRRWLEKHDRMTGARSNSVMTHALFIKAWNAYRDGRLTEQLSWKVSGTQVEQFPVPR